MTCGLPWSEKFIVQLEDKARRNAFVADQVRTRIALIVRQLRDQSDRKWSQTELGDRMGKPQNVVSRLENPDYGRMSLASLLEVAAAFDLPLWVDMPEWDDWLRKIKAVPDSSYVRSSFCIETLVDTARAAEATSNYNVVKNIKFRFDAPGTVTYVRSHDSSSKVFETRNSSVGKEIALGSN